MSTPNSSEIYEAARQQSLRSRGASWEIELRKAAAYAGASPPEDRPDVLAAYVCMELDDRRAMIAWLAHATTSRPDHEHGPDALGQCYACAIDRLAGTG